MRAQASPGAAGVLVPVGRVATISGLLSRRRLAETWLGLDPSRAAPSAACRRSHNIRRYSLRLDCALRLTTRSSVASCVRRTLLEPHLVLRHAGLLFSIATIAYNSCISTWAADETASHSNRELLEL